MLPSGVLCGIAVKNTLKKIPEGKQSEEICAQNNGQPL